MFDMVFVQTRSRGRMTADYDSAKARRDAVWQEMQTLKKEIRALEKQILNAMTVLYVAVPLLGIAVFFAATLASAPSLTGGILALLGIITLGVLARVTPLRHSKQQKEDARDDAETRYRYFYLKAQILNTLDRAPDDSAPEMIPARKRRQSRRLESLMDDAKQSRDAGSISDEAYEELMRIVLFE